MQTAALAAPSLDAGAQDTANSGDRVTVSYTVSNPTEPGQDGKDITVQISPGSAECVQCNPLTVPAGQVNIKGTAVVKMPNVAAGAKQRVTVRVDAGDGIKDDVIIMVNGPAAPTNVRQVSGKVKDGSGKALSGARVAMSDSQGHQYSTTTNGAGLYSFTSSDSAPIAVGKITVAAVLDGYTGAETSVTGRADKTVNAPITLKAATTASASASASPTASVSAAATEEEPTDDETTDETNETNTQAATEKTSEESGSTSWMMILMGGLLVAGGVGVMVMVWMRRKNAAGNNDSDTGAGFGGPTGSPAGPGRFGGADATRVAAPVGAGRAQDATMVAGAGMGAGGLGDAPTMIHRPPVEDEFPDPYGAPIPPQGGFVGAGNGQWADQGAGGNYGGATSVYGGQGGQGGQGGGFDNGQQRYDEQTNMYQPNSTGYDDQGGYGAQGGYDQGGGYGAQGGYDQGGYGNQGNQAGWGNQPDNGDGYGPQGGYGAQGGYDQGGGYGAQGGYDQGGYDNQGYDQHGGNYGGQGGQGGQAGGYEQNNGYGNQQGGYDQHGGAYGQDPNRRNWEQ
ncbi:carboxypeptidase-like regulatory domain-containing protein [Actinoplanes regularis]|uniref:carboxypeptidase-like regulatory domain-containing protein n=1 Tax=Actinoplanes regularis TaxID=52697 RepID=UPI002557A44C|nr:carboxypeptidase-like regulatory domain-containing protein [Actinoplanes regularis]